MKQVILFIQGAGEGAHEEDRELVASLRKSLGSAFEIRYPRMPDESEPDYQKWKSALVRELENIQGDAIIVGHSLGASFLVKLLAEKSPDTAIAGLFLIATPYWGGRGWRYVGYEELELPDGVSSRLPGGTPIYLYHSRNDETVPFEHLALYADALPGARIRQLNRGHQLDGDLTEVIADIRKLGSDPRTMSDKRGS